MTMTNWIRACATSDIELEELMRFDHGAQTLCIYHAPDGTFFATEGNCSHEKVHLCDGLVMDYTIECPKHNGVFDYRTGEARGAPACVNLKTFPVKVEGDQVFVAI
jgi:3-phenylpropionate/trans-cinnamate dioxygenase ferredoxin component